MGADQATIPATTQQVNGVKNNRADQPSPARNIAAAGNRPDAESTVRAGQQPFVEQKPKIEPADLFKQKCDEAWGRIIDGNESVKTLLSGDYEYSREVLQEADKMRPNFPETLAALGYYYRETGDTAQAAGHLPLDCGALGVDLVAFTGHKGMLGPQGTGGLWVRAGLEVEPLIRGGTGGDSTRRDMPDAVPDRRLKQIEGPQDVNVGITLWLAHRDPPRSSAPRGG
jgi:hypothetical protein